MRFHNVLPLKIDADPRLARRLRSSLCSGYGHSIGGNIVDEEHFGLWRLLNEALLHYPLTAKAKLRWRLQRTGLLSGMADANELAPGSGSEIEEYFGRPGDHEIVLTGVAVNTEGNAEVAARTAPASAYRPVLVSAISLQRS